ncbi:MAG: PQQ-binding-like beta-propeller repeat protein [Acidobacteriota bacterium]|nr:PQQ-binding-like beta-propeller repeat protein [Acidobacteriota bacterium]
MLKKILPCLIAVLPLLVFAGDDSTDWPAFRGLKGDGVSPETGLLPSWPEEGPKLVWKTKVGTAFSGMTLVRGRMYTMVQEGEGDQKSEFVVAFDPENGAQLWKTRIGKFFDDEFGDGPRATPTVDGDTVYSLGSRGNLASMSADKGEILWTVDFQKEFESEVPQWGFSSSALIEGDVLIIETGGGEGELYAGFNKKTGKLLWRLETGKGTYMTPVHVKLGGQSQFVTVKGFEDTHVVGFNSKGKLLWSHPYSKQTMVIATPVFVAPDRFLISATGNGGAMMIRVKNNGGKYQVEELWRHNRFKNHFSSSIYHEGHIYGFDSALLKCIDAETGEQKWVTRGFGKGSLIAAEGKLYVLGDRGQLALVEATPEKFTRISQFNALQGKSWTAPTLVGGRLYLRNAQEMACFDIRKAEPVQ